MNVLVLGGTRGPGRAVDMFSRGTQFLLAAMARHGVRRVVCVTCAGTGDGPGPRGFLRGRVMRPLFRSSIGADRDRQESQLRGSNVDWTIVQPAVLTAGPATGLFQTVTDDAPGPFQRISRADVADFIGANLAAPDYVHATVVLAG